MHIKKRNRSKRKRFFALTISPKTIKLLNTTLPFMLSAFLWFGGAYIEASLQDPIRAEIVFRPIAEHLLVSLALLIGGAAVIDCSIARGDFDK